MAKIRIVTDSTCDLPPELLEQYGILMVPLKVMFGDKVYRDGVDLSSKEFYAKLRNASDLPTTSQPSPQEFMEAYRPLVEEGASIVSLHISGSLSGTLQSARLAKTMLNYDDLEIVDTRLVSTALGLAVLAAARAAAANRSKEEVLAAAGWVTEHLQAYFLVDTLEYLQRGGRIGKAQAFLGSLLNIKPVLMLKEGIIYPYEKVRGKARAMDRLVEIVAEKFNSIDNLWCAIVHGDDPEGLEQLREKMQNNKVTCSCMLTGEIGSVVGTHAGPGLLGIIGCPAPRL
ncbi:DegV family protein [Thermanaeromonas sp. C210]|uniref:DegV family protein n=1 Tax=Thermanaeromonas sp. C210 TaxID=2731925 RepID=UPI00155CE7B4|nr:DegV family protein [Thermanaeromonas sp. C210]GFN22150.1 DegV family protein [Thermanaeromonas sp. C210]